MLDRPAVDLYALSDLSTPWCVHVVATLRIAEHIAAGLADSDDLAAAAGCDAGWLRQVLRQLISKGVFEEPAPGQFALNAAAEGLLDPGLRLGLDLDSFGGRMAHAWSTLLAAVRAGTPQYATLFGRPFWEDLDAHPALAADFDALMGPAGHGVPDPNILLSGDWATVRRVVDVGGGTGALLAEILRGRPAMLGTLVDLPRTVARAAEVFAAVGVAERVTLSGQSFFDPLPAGADLYVLSKVLSDFPDPEATTLLRRCGEAARPSGRVVVLGGVSPDDAPLGLTIETVLLGGKQRTLAEFSALAATAGLRASASGRLMSGRFAVECRPA
jgi:SAM-dependent methyltransferase